MKFNPVVLLFLIVVDVQTRNYGIGDKIERIKHLQRQRRHSDGSCRGWSSWFNYWCHTCERYASTSICCNPYSNGCCSRYDLHDKPNCGNSNSYHSDPCSCNEFYQCFNSKLNHFTCPFRGAWDDDDKKCKKVTKIPPTFCQNRPYYSADLPSRFIDVHITAVNGSTNIANFTQEVPANDVYNIMVHLQGSRQDFTFTAAFYDNFWYFIRCINGVCSNSDWYWKFSLNGNYSNVGVSSVVATGNVKIEFDYSNISNG